MDAPPLPEGTPLPPPPPGPPPPPRPPGPDDCLPGVVTYDGSLFGAVARSRRTSLAQIVLDNNLPFNTTTLVGTRLNITCPPGQWSEPFGLWEGGVTFAGKIAGAQVHAMGWGVIDMRTIQPHNQGVVCVQMVAHPLKVGKPRSRLALLQPQLLNSNNPPSCPTSPPFGTLCSGEYLPAGRLHHRAAHQAVKSHLC